VPVRIVQSNLHIVPSWGDVQVEVSTPENSSGGGRKVEASTQQFEDDDIKAAAAPPKPQQSGRKLYLLYGLAVAAALTAAVIVAVVVVLTTKPTQGGQETTPSPVPTQSPLGTPLPPMPTTTPEPSPTPTPTTTLWGTNPDYAELCASDSSYQYFCNADCMVNCALLEGQNGLLIEAGSFELEYCSSTHDNPAYDQGSTCCCAEWIPVTEQNGLTVPCHGGATPMEACNTWCKLHDEVLQPGAVTDCDPGFLWCKPFGNLGDAEECSMAIVCSETQHCCCDIMT